MSGLFHYPRLQDEDDIRPPHDARVRVARLKERRDALGEGLVKGQKRLEEVRAYLELSPKVEDGLKSLSEQMFEEDVRMIERHLSDALVEVLDQPIRLRAETDFKRGAATVEFFIERNGEREDIMKGQGGSVVNVLSVGLRMFALARLDPARHRPFLVLDEPDGWLRPELVPKLVNIIARAGKNLGYQVILISHHEIDVFKQYADKIYDFKPQPDGSVKVVLWTDKPAVEDFAVAEVAPIPASPIA